MREDGVHDDSEAHGGHDEHDDGLEAQKEHGTAVGGEVVITKGPDHILSLPLQLGLVRVQQTGLQSHSGVKKFNMYLQHLITVT